MLLERLVDSKHFNLHRTYMLIRLTAKERRLEDTLPNALKEHFAGIEPVVGEREKKLMLKMLKGMRVRFGDEVR